MTAYDPDCEFSDPFVSFTGVDRYKQNSPREAAITRRQKHFLQNTFLQNTFLQNTFLQNTFFAKHFFCKTLFPVYM